MSDAEVVLLGTGIIRPDPERSGPATLLRFGGELILVDCGEGTTRQLLHAGVQPTDVRTVFFTHLHADHILGYPYFLVSGWSDGRRSLRVYGPAGTARMHAAVVEHLLAEDLDRRAAFGRPGEGLRDVAVSEIGPGTVDYSGDVGVSVMRTRHSPENLAYRFQYRGCSVVVSGDTGYFEPLAEFSRGADLLLLECSMVEDARRALYHTPEGQRVWQRLLDEHLTPGQAAALARLAGVPRLVLHHLPRGVKEERIAAEVRATYPGEVIVGRDLLVVPVRGGKQEGGPAASKLARA